MGMTEKIIRIWEDETNYQFSLSLSDPENYFRIELRHMGEQEQEFEFVKCDIDRIIEGLQLLKQEHGY